MFLTDEQNEEVANLLKGEPVVEDDGDHSAPNEAIEASTQTDANTEESSTPEQNEDSGHAVPYSRFKSVIEARNELRNRTSALEKQLAELQDQLEKRPATPQHREEKSYFDFDDESTFEDPVESRFQSYEERIYQMEVQNEQVKLNREIEVAQSRFPDVGREMLLQAVINDPNADVMDVAERYSTFVNGLREQAIADYVKTNQMQKAKPAAPPVVTTAGSSQYGRIPGSSGEGRPKNMEEARNSLFDYLKANWSNS